MMIKDVLEMVIREFAMMLTTIFMIAIPATIVLMFIYEKLRTLSIRIKE